MSPFKKWIEWTSWTEQTLEEWDVAQHLRWCTKIRQKIFHIKFFDPQQACTGVEFRKMFLRLLLDSCEVLFFFFSPWVCFIAPLFPEDMVIVTETAWVTLGTLSMCFPLKTFTSSPFFASFFFHSSRFLNAICLPRKNRSFSEQTVLRQLPFFGNVSACWEVSSVQTQSSHQTNPSQENRCRSIMHYTSYLRTNDCTNNGYVTNMLEHNTVINIDTGVHMISYITQTWARTLSTDH